jgi:hypothetical protein
MERLRTSNACREHEADLGVTIAELVLWTVFGLCLSVNVYVIHRDKDVVTLTSGVQADTLDIVDHSQMLHTHLLAYLVHRTDSSFPILIGCEVGALVAVTLLGRVWVDVSTCSLIRVSGVIVELRVRVIIAFISWSDKAGIRTTGCD